MKKHDIGILIVLLGAVSFIAPILIRCYQDDILLGVTATGGFMIAIGLIMVVTSKITHNNHGTKDRRDI